MTIIDKKISAFTTSVADLPDVPTPSATLTAAELKAKFDAAPNELRQAFNDLIDALSTSGGATELASSHQHDTRYYTKSQVDVRVMGLEASAIEGLVAVSEDNLPPAEETIWLALL